MSSIKGQGEQRVKSMKVNERGAASVIVAIVLVVLLGFAALAVDVGAMYAEKAQLQNGADSAALAVANQCAKGSCGNTTDTGDLFANSNANDGSSGATVTFPNSTTVHVETKARAAGSTTDGFGLFFARVMGFNNTQIHATAEASWGSVSGATSFPWTISDCVFKKYLSASQLNEFNSTGTFTGTPTPTHILLRYDTNTPAYSGCAVQNGYAPGGFGWLNTGSDCKATIDAGTTVVGTNPGNDLPNVCSTMPSLIMNEPILVPVFSSAVPLANGNNTKYTIVGFLAFKVTGYKFSGNVASPDPLAPSCSGNCRGIQGYFTRFVSLAEGLSTSNTVANYGGSEVFLKN
ncbi:pilus assembly protein TadG-related protein [Pseudarthrobacter sp. BRE9]|uniref:Tad domain-containing protein n=1 Tax=Pseudarthrobacter sp. BRE9 TaxID=2962582 RepID=UPI002880FF77|nr:pilus assembly protein TadG-related protein [Pseudarthrobacter sp. BRE9]MDT0167843.1 pilus assembly protein TadG-related protein [Pseudarthrobacter sp. BRE9]